MLPSDIFILALNHSCLGRQPENLPLTAQRVLRCNFVKVRVFLFFFFLLCREAIQEMSEPNCAAQPKPKIHSAGK